MKTKINIFLYKILFFVIPVLVFFEVLFHLSFYPIITNSTLFDLKMIGVQKQHIKNLKVVAIGSSIMLYDFNSGIFVQNIQSSYYNFGSWGLQVSDLKMMINSFINRYHPKYVIFCSSFTDFISPPNDSYLNYTNTDYMIKDNFPEYFYLFNYHSIHQVIRRKLKSYPVKLDNWGGSSFNVKIKDIVWNKWNEHGIFPTKYTNQNYRDLDTLSAILTRQHIKFIFIQAPLKKSYANTVLSQQIIKSHFDRCRSIIEGEGGIYLNYYNTTVFKDSLFIDQYHLQGTGAVVLTKEAVTDLKKIIQ
jgi:hypothetical protein